MKGIFEIHPTSGAELNDGDGRPSWQEKGRACRFTETGICIARIAVACQCPSLDALAMVQKSRGKPSLSKRVYGRQIAAARAALGWSQNELSRRSGVATQTISGYERGERKTKSASIIAMSNACRKAGVEFVEGGIEFNGEVVRLVSDRMSETES